MICFCYFCQIWAWPIMTSFLCKKAIFKRFCQIFFGTTRMQHKLLILTESPNIFYWKSAKKGKQMWSLGQNLGRTRSNVAKKTTELAFRLFFFFIFSMGYTFKSKKQCEWKYPSGNQLEIPYFKEIRTKFLSILGQKQQKVIVQVFTLVSL